MEVIQGQRQGPAHRPGDHRRARGINPWVDSVDFDHHGYGKVVATKDAFDCEMVRMKTIKKKTTSRLPAETGMHYHVARGQQSIKGTSL